MYRFRNTKEESAWRNKMKVRLVYKFLLIFFLFTIGLGLAISYGTSGNYEKAITQKYYESAKNVAKLAASVVNGDKIEQYAVTLEKDEDYEKTLERLNNIKNQTGVYYLYVMYPLSEEEGIYIFDAKLTPEQVAEVGDTESTLGVSVEFIDEEGVDNFISAKNVLQTGKIGEALEETNTLQGNKMQHLGSIYAPVTDSKGKIKAFVGVDVRMDDVKTSVEDAIMEMIRMIVLVAVVFFILLFIVVEISVIIPIRNLKEYAERISEGKFGEEMQVRGHDEISEISEVFNRMSKSINGHVEEVEIINEAYHKYVPSEMFDILQKDQVTDVKLGDQIMSNLSVMSFDIINFNALTKKMNSDQMFSFINRILNPVTPLAGKNGGVIQLFEECGFVVFQKDSCERLLETAIEMSQKLHKVLEKEARFIRSTARYGMAIAYGDVMLGIVGAENRMAAITVSEPNNICAYLSSRADKYYSHILITATAVSMIEDFEKKYNARCIGYLYVTALGQTEKIYDVFDGDSDEDRRLKEQTKTLFEAGVNFYYTRDFDRARTCFIDILKVFRQDSAAREYLYRCNQFYNNEQVENKDIYIEVY